MGMLHGADEFPSNASFAFLIALKGHSILHASLVITMIVNGPTLKRLIGTLCIDFIVITSRAGRFLNREIF